VRWREHPKFGRNVLSPTGDEDSSTVSAEDAKFESRRRVIIDPTVEAGTGGHRERGNGDARRFENRGNPEDGQTGEAEGQRTRGNPRTHRRHGRKMRDSGQPFGATWRLYQQGGAGSAGLGVTRELGARPTEGCEKRGNLNLHRRSSRKMQELGQPGKCIGKRGRKPGDGETRKLAEGGAEGCERRGDSNLHRRQVGR